VTVQNKVEPEVARALHAELTAAFRPETALAAGFGLWHYRGGPWEPAGEFVFRDRGGGDAVDRLGAGADGNTGTAPDR
jgi:hypothetical protein